MVSIGKFEGRVRMCTYRKSEGLLKEQMRGK